MFCSMILGFFVGAIAFKALRHAMFFHGGGCHVRRFGPYGRGYYGRGFGPGFGPGFAGPGCGPGFGPGRGYGGADCAGPGFQAGWNNGWNHDWNHGWDPRDEAAFASRGPTRSKATGISLDEVTKGLELHERQRAEAEPVLSRVKEWLGSRGPRVEAVLLVLAADRFDGESLLPLLAELPPTERRELVEGLEHLHTILISEQREVLRKALGISSAPQNQ